MTNKKIRQNKEIKKKSGPPRICFICFIGFKLFLLVALPVGAPLDSVLVLT